MAERLFTADDAWSGGFYELALELGPRSDDRLRAALVALWRRKRGRRKRDRFDTDRLGKVDGCPPACQERREDIAGQTGSRRS
jgi:hypothetical protein